MIALPDAFFDAPLAHRGLHDLTKGRPENSRAAIRAGLAAGYGLEIDVQLSFDGSAMVFHDDVLDRLTGESGAIRLRPADQLRDIQLKGGNEGIPDLPEVLELVRGQVPLLIEIKDQDGEMGTDIGPLEAATAQALIGYDGPVAVMSFNPNSIARMAELAPNLPRGLVTSAYKAKDWPLPARVRETLKAIPDYDRVGASFISHEVKYLSDPRVAELKTQGARILCWTVKSQATEEKAREIADNITFEGYKATRQP